MALPPLKISITADPTQAVSGLKQVDTAVKTTTGNMTGAKGAAGGMAGGMAALGNVSSQTRSKIQNASFQIQDIIVQLQGGTRASVALSQQLPQLAGAFGAVGAALGVGLALGIPAVAMAMNAMKGEAFDLEASLDVLSERMDTYKEFADLAALSTAELTARFGGAGEGAAEFFGILAEFEGQRVQDEIDAIAAGLANFQNIAGDGDARSGLANFFDLELMFAFTDASREARQEARTLTSEFVSQQKILAQSEGNLRDQIAAMQNLVETAIALANANGEVTEEEEAFIKSLSDALLKMQEQNGELTSGVGLLASMTANGDALTASLGTAWENAAGMAGALWDAAKAQAAANLAEMEGSANRYVQSGGMDAATSGARNAAAGTSQNALASFGTATSGAGGVRRATPATGGGGGAASSGGVSSTVSTRAAEIEALVDSLKTESEILEEWRAEGLVTLAEASAAELEAIGGINESKLRLEEEYQERLAAIKQTAHADGLSTILSSGSEVLAALGQTNDKALKMSQTFAAAEALVNSYRAAAQVLADPSIPFWGKFAAVASTVAAGVGLVNSIKSVSKSGNSSGSTSGSSSSSSTASASSQGPLDVRLSGLGMNDIVRGSDVASLFDMLNEEAGDRGLNVSFAT